MNNISSSAPKNKLKRPGPLSKTRNKELSNISDSSNDQIEVIFLEIDSDSNKESKQPEENATITVSADSFNNFEDLKLEKYSSSRNSEIKIVKTYSNSNRQRKISDTESRNNEKIKNSEKTNENDCLKTVANDEIKHKTNECKSFVKNNSEIQPKTTETPKNSLSAESPEKIKNVRKSVDENFEEIIIKGEIHETVDNNLKINDKTVEKVGEAQPTKQADCGTGTSTPVVFNKSPVDVKKNNRVFIIKNLAGKKVTLIPKSTPVVLNNSPKPAPAKLAENSVNKTVAPNSLSDAKPVVKTLKIIKPINKECGILNNVMKISDVNKSQRYFNDKQQETTKSVTDSPSYCNLRIEKTESLSVRKYPRKIIEKIDLTDSKGMKNNAQTNTMPSFSKILQALTGTPAQAPKPGKSFSLEETKIPIYVDCQTQTDSVTIYKDKSVQTDVYMPSPTSSIEDLPNITNLLEYVFSTPKYSSGLDEIKKSDLIDMSKNIVMKGKVMSQVPRGEDALKKQLFMDLKDCATFDFLGNKPVHNAVLENNLKFLKRQIFALRLRKIPVDIENNQGQTALQLAVAHNCGMEIITSLLLNGASANILDNEGNTLVHLAVINNTHFVLELLIKHLVNPVKEINRKNDEGLTALMIASIDSKPEMVDMLLRNKADPNLRDEKSGRTALFHAVELNCNFVINLLLKYKADPKVRNYFGLTALDAAKDLDIADSKILEAERESNSLSNQTSVIVNMSALNKPNESSSATTPGSKRVRSTGNPRLSDDSKKSKLSFVSSYQKVQISNVKTASNNVKTTPATNGNSGSRRKRK